MPLFLYSEEHIEGFREAVGVVARERKYISMFDAFPMESSRAFVRDNIKNRYPQFVVVSDGRVVGWCDVTPKMRDMHRHCGTLGLGLLPEFRGQGIGRKLMQTTIDAAFAFGLKRIELHVFASNENAIALYKKLGFELEGTHKNACNPGDGTYIDLCSMALMRF